jgi:hypothetical protein
MHCLATAGKHVNNIRATARQPPTTIIEGLLEGVLSVGYAPRLYSEDPRLAKGNSAKSACEDRTRRLM